MTLLGAVRPGRMPTRLDARPGDLVAVTGTIGDAALGLVQRLEPERAAGWRLDSAEREHLRNRYLLPQPRTALAEAVGRHARAAMDVSDGLVGDLEGSLASVFAASIEAGGLPLSTAASKTPRRSEGARDRASGGDDYGSR